MKYNRCKHTGMLRKNGNLNKSECAFCNKMSHETSATHQRNQWFPANALDGSNQDCSDEANCVVFHFKDPGAGFLYKAMKMSDLFPTTYTVGDPTTFPPHRYGKWDATKRLGILEADAGYFVPQEPLF